MRSLLSALVAGTSGDLLPALYKEMLVTSAFLVGRVILRKTHQVSVTVVLLTGRDLRDIRTLNLQIL